MWVWKREIYEEEDEEEEGTGVEVQLNSGWWTIYYLEENYPIADNILWMVDGGKELHFMGAL